MSSTTFMLFMYSYGNGVEMERRRKPEKGEPTLEWGLYACPVTSKPKRCRKNMTLSFRSCESRIGSAVALRKRVLSWSSTQTSKTVASIEVHELIMAPIRLILPFVKSSSSSSYVHIFTFPGVAPRENIGSISGDPKEKVWLLWLKTESKSTS